MAETASLWWTSAESLKARSRLGRSNDRRHLPCQTCQLIRPHQGDRQLASVVIVA